MIDDLNQLLGIYRTALVLGKLHNEELQYMRCTCAFQSEIDSASSKMYSTSLNSKHSSNFNKGE